MAYIGQWGIRITVTINAVFVHDPIGLLAVWKKE